MFAETKKLPEEFEAAIRLGLISRKGAIDMLLERAGRVPELREELPDWMKDQVDRRPRDGLVPIPEEK